MSFKKLSYDCFVGGAKQSNLDNSALYHSIIVNGKLVKTLIDTGSPVCFISCSFFKNNFDNLPVLNSRQKFYTVSGDKFHTLGCVLMDIIGFEKTLKHEFYIIDSPIDLLLGMDALIKLEATLSFNNKHKAVSRENKFIAPVKLNSYQLSREEFLSLFKLESTCSSVEELAALKNLLFEFRDIFSTSSYDLGLCNVGYHNIVTGSAEPVYLKPYRTPHALRETAENMIKDMLDNDIIEKSQSAWSSPFILIDKADGTKRFAIES